MLVNGLGDLLSEEVRAAKRFADLFSGSGAVAIHVAERFDVPVLASDLQRFSAVLAQSVLSRCEELEWQPLWKAWHRRAARRAKCTRPPAVTRLTQALVSEVRTWCSQQVLPLTRAYGGHYFSPIQALWLDALRSSLPRTQPANTVALAALIQAASHCAAAPGHTAQPFQPTRTGKPYLVELWERDVVQRTMMSFAVLCETYARKPGTARVADASEVASELRKNDVAFIDPPYSDVQYSRFYHVLETVADGGCGMVSGVGRYPAASLRPRSAYSLKSESAIALKSLLEIVASRGARAIVTFPDHDCSNGLSGEDVRQIADSGFRISQQIVASTFSSMGGTGAERRSVGAARAPSRSAKELILVLAPR